MEILIHGRKNGYTVLYPKPTPINFYSFASDIQSINANNYDFYYGKKFYTIAFVKGGCIFTIYVIGNDVERGQLGEIGISIFIPINQKLSGIDVKNLLDELINTYCINYIFDNKIVEPKNGFDELLFTSIANGYDSKIAPSFSDYNNIIIGTQDPAFHYYLSEEELIEHLDKPFQEEYNDYKQILLIDSNFQGDANPLNVIKNSGIEVNPDLKNELYYLNKYNHSKGVKITANGKPRYDGKGNNQIRSKWLVEVNYSKDDRCYEPIKVSGTISNVSSEIHKYLDIKGNQIMLKYDIFYNPNPKIKQVRFEIYDRNGNVIDNAEIICQNYYSQLKKTVINNQILFIGEELRERWSVLVHNGDASGKTEFIPAEQNENVKITVEERNIITINVKDENGKKLSDFEVWTKLTNGYQKSNTIEFVDKQIIDSYNVKVRKKGYKDVNIPNFSPYKQNSIDVELKTDQPHRKQHSNKNGSDIENTFTAKKIFSKPVIIATSISSLIFLAFLLWIFFHFFISEKLPKETILTVEQITAYVEGDSLILDKLEDIKENWRKQEQDFIIKSGGGLFGGDEKKDSTKWESDWKPINDTIELAITKREFINNKNFAAFKNLHYSKDQQIFKSAIDKIDSTKYAEVGENLIDVSALTLTQIAKKIIEFLNPKEPPTDSITQKAEKEEVKTSEHPVAPHKEKKPNTTNSSTQQKTGTTDIRPEILEYINGNVLEKAKLEEYKNAKGINPTLKNSIQLCLDFWDLDNSGSGKNAKTYCNFKKKLENDPNFNKSKLKAFIEKMCNNNLNLYGTQDKKRGLK